MISGGGAVELSFVRESVFALSILLWASWGGAEGSPPAPRSGDPVFVGAGDIGECGYGAAQTAALLQATPGTVFTLGDNAYQSGSPRQFRECYDPSWGREKSRTRPSPGNHDYRTDQARPYFEYFGAQAGPPGRGYYSYDLGAWHVLSLNSNLEGSAEEEQEKWLREDLSASPSACSLAYWHHPLFSSGPHGNNPHMKNVWKILEEFDADVILAGHDHDYERFAPQNAEGKADAQGIREFVVGTGGAKLYEFRPSLLPTSERHKDAVWGVLKLTLHPGSYDWEFLPVAGASFQDAGQDPCHDKRRAKPPAP
jgi:hypothetical protein